MSFFTWAEATLRSVTLGEASSLCLLLLVLWRLRKL